jgi:hypothetical protein
LAVIWELLAAWIGELDDGPSGGGAEQTPEKPDSQHRDRA